nr:hypothetical protein [Pseudodesulfovibrio sp.]
MFVMEDISANGLMVYDNQESKFYFWDGSKWNNIGSGDQNLIYGTLVPDVADYKKGDMFFDETTKSLYVHNLTEWVAINSSGTVVNDLTTGGTTNSLSAEQGKTLKGLVDVNTVKEGITSAQASVIANTSGTNTGDQDISGIAANATAITDEGARATTAESANASDISTLQSEQTTQNTAISQNTAKAGLTVAQASEITANTVKVGYTEALVSANTDVAANTAKAGITAAQAAIIVATSGTNTGDQNITGIITNASNITTLEAEQTTQNTSILSHTGTLVLKEDKANKNLANGYAGLDANTKIDVSQLPAITMNNVYTVVDQASQTALLASQGDVAIRTDVSKNYIHNGGTAGTMDDWSELASPSVDVSSVNGKTGNVILGISDIATLQSNLDTKTTDIATLQGEQTIQNTAISQNTAKTGITASQAAVIVATSGTNTGDQDITGIITNASNITTLEAEQTTQNTSIISHGATLLLKEDKANKNLANGYAGLDANTKIDLSQLPAITMNNVYTVIHQAAQLALTPNQGDVAIRTDVSKNYIHNGGSAGTMSDWSELASPSVDVTSVNGKTGNVVIGITDIASLQTNLDTKTTDIATLQGEQITQNTAIGLNTAKTGITAAQASEITANTVKLSYTDAAAVALNTAKVGYTDALVSANTDVAANTAKTGITTAQASEITANTAKVSYTDAAAVALNTAKVSYTEALVSANTDVAANTAKTGITAAQADKITANTVKVGYTEALVSANTDVAANTAKTGITAAQADEITANTVKVGYTEALVSANTDVAANTAKTGITAAQASEITANTVKVGYTEALVSANTDVAANTAKTGITAAQADEITANTAKVGYTEALVSANTDVAANTAKTGITAAQADEITANTVKVGYTEALVSANTDVAANTAKTGITAGQAAIVAATSGINTGDQDITGIITNASNITAIETEQTTQNTAITTNTSKIGVPAGGANGQVLKTDGSSNYTWVAQTTDTNTQLSEAAVDAFVANNGYTSYIIGEIKQTIASSMPSGWVKLNGVAISSLTSTQRTQAANLGLSGNLPNATNAYLSQNNATLGSVSGSNSKTIARNNLPNATLSGNTGYAGTHTHTPKGTYTKAVRVTGKDTSNGQDNSSGEIDVKRAGTISLNTSGNHRHSFTTSSINGGVTQQKLNITPYTLSVNTFIYLGL